MARVAASLLVLASAAGKATAFSGAPRAVEVKQPHRAGVVAPVQLFFEEPTPTSGNSYSTSALLIGACVATATALRISSQRSSGRGQREAVIAHGKVSPSGWKFQPIEGRVSQGVEGAPPRGPSYRPWITLRHKAKRGQRYHRQQKILKESNIQSANGGWHTWYPHRAVFNLYQGPDSHPDNPWFPAASPGYDKTEMGPPRNGLQTRSPYLTSDATVSDDSATATEAFRTVVAPVTSGSAFVTGCAPALSMSARSKTLLAGRSSTRSLRCGVIMKAHKKAASSTKNQGNKQNAQFYGLTAKGYQGSAVKSGQMLVRQKGFKWYAGANVVVGKDFTLSALKDGIVQWRGTWKHKELFIVPWQYVRERCQWINPNRLGPLKYEPWMNGEFNHGRNKPQYRERKRNHIKVLMEEWKEKDEGKEWTTKKEEKDSKQKDIQLKIRAIRKAKRAGTREAKPVAAAEA